MNKNHNRSLSLVGRLVRRWLLFNLALGLITAPARAQFPGLPFGAIPLPDVPTIDLGGAAVGGGAGLGGWGLALAGLLILGPAIEARCNAQPQEAMR